MGITVIAIAIALAAQAAGQEVTTFHPLPSQAKEEQAKQEAPKPASDAPEAAVPATPPAAAEKIEVVSVRDVPADANVLFVPPPPQP